MKTNEFIKEAEVMGFEVKISFGWLGVYSDDLFVLKVNKNHIFSVDTNSVIFDGLEKTKKQQLFKLLIEYASTPIEERKEEKRYRYYLKDTTGLNLNHGNLLYKQKDFNNFMFDIDMFNENEIKCEFTHKELRACGINLTLLQENYKEVEVK